MQFFDFLDLPNERLRAELESASPLNRVWAAWALGLRHDIDGAAVRQTLRLEPHPGVRRHLAVLLAGAAETDALLALFEHDPCDEVRVSALQLLLQSIPREDRQPRAAMLVQQVLGDPSERFRALCLRSVDAQFIDAGVSYACLRDPAPTVRGAAIELCMSAPRLATETVVSLVLDAIGRHPDSGQRREWWARARAWSGDERLLRGVDPESPELVIELLGFLCEQNAAQPWSRLERFAPMTHHTIMARLLRLLEAPVPAAAGALASWSRLAFPPRGTAETSSASEIGWLALNALARLPWIIDEAELQGTVDRETVNGLLAQVQHAIANPESDDASDWVEEFLEHLKYIESSLLKLLS
jgi:hypothetical protein